MLSINPEQMQFALCTDEAYLPIAGVALTSLLVNRKSDKLVHIHIVHPGISDKGARALQSLSTVFNCSIDFHRVDSPRVAKLRGHLHITNVMYFRLLLPQILQDCMRVIYLDCDLAVETDLQELWDLDLNSRAVAGWDEGDSYHLKRLECSDFYINSGVLVMDLDHWRAKSFGERCINWIEKNPEKAVLPDQDAINVVLSGSKIRIHERFNLNPVWRPEHDLLSRYPDRILHFGGPIKPWDACYDFTLAAIYRKYVEISPWRESLKTREVANPTQGVILAHQLAKEGKLEVACRTYHDALGKLVLRCGGLSTLLIQTINHAAGKFNRQDLVGSIHHYKDAVEILGLPRDYAKNIYGLPGLLESQFDKMPNVTGLS